MATEIRNDMGSIKISNSVIAKIAGYVATQCYGVVGMCTKSGKDGISKLLKKDNIDKGIKVKVEDNAIDLTLFIIAEYGLNISSIGESIRSNVKYNVEKLTGMEVSNVRVNVESIRVE